MKPRPSSLEYPTTARILLPEQKRFEQLCSQVSTSLSAAGVSLEAFLATLPAVRKRVYERHYGTKAGSAAPRRRSGKRLSK
jgi:hypothetical protein